MAGRTRHDRKASSNASCRLAADVRAGEGASAVLLAVNVFLLLAAYYTIRPLRSALLLPVEIPLPGGGVMAGPEIQSYTGAILAGAVPVHRPALQLVRQPASTASG